MANFNAAAQEVFQILRSYDYEVMLFDDGGMKVADPADARRMFAKPENLLVSVVEDEGDNHMIRLYIGNSTNVSDILGLIDSLRVAATKYNMVWNVKKYGHDISPEQFATPYSVREAHRIADRIVENMQKTLTKQKTRGS